ncbi:MAG: cadherin-like domain-containing protein, partial [Candidatus Thiodiazotropha endolucinida]
MHKGYKSRLTILILIPLLTLPVSVFAKGKPVKTLRITEAAYDGTLTVTGDRAARNTEVIVSNPNPDVSQSWSTTSNRRGQWVLSVADPQPVPCRVSASDGANEASADVVGAPDDCDGTVVVNTPPTAMDDNAETDLNQQVVIDLLANDSDGDGSLDPASLDFVSLPTNGSLSDNGDGTVVYQPDTDFFGSDSFDYQVSDDQGAPSNTATVSVTVNDPPPPPPVDPVSINSTSANTALPASPVTERP